VPEQAAGFVIGLMEGAAPLSGEPKIAFNHPLV
jgi:hypothetical protein